MRISDWSSDVCSSDLSARDPRRCEPRRWPPWPRRGQPISEPVTAGPWSARWSAAYAPGWPSCSSSPAATHRKSVVGGKGVADRVDLGGRLTIKKTDPTTHANQAHILEHD